MRRMRFRTHFWVMFIFPLSLWQQGRLIELKSANELHVRTVGNEEVRELIGNVHFIQVLESGELIKVWCDSALRYMSQNKIELFGNVRIVRDSVTLTSREGIYYGNERRAEIRRGVRLTRGKMILVSRYGEYFTEEKRSFFKGEVVVVDSASTTMADQLTYFERDDQSIAVGYVRVDNPANNITVFGDSLVHFHRQRYSIVPRNPRLLRIDSSAADGRIDSLLVISRMMEAFQDSLQRFVASESVVMAGNDFQARCGRATFFQNKDLTALEENPVVWYGQNQITGDSIAITLKDRRLQQVYVRGRAMAVSRADSLRPSRFDQLSGRELVLHFEKDKLSRIESKRTATSLYYLYEQEQPNGVSRSSGDEIVIDFADGRADRIKVVGGVEGRYFPEPMIVRRESEFNLDGFRWMENRPRRKDLEIENEQNE